MEAGARAIVSMSTAHHRRKKADRYWRSTCRGVL